MNSIQGRTILLVDDELDLLTLHKRILARTGVNILIAGNGREAFDIALEQLPDLIITDMMMRDYDGHWLIEHFKNDSRLQHIPIIVVTANARSVIEHVHVHKVLSKPIMPNELVSQVSDILEAS